MVHGRWCLPACVGPEPRYESGRGLVLVEVLAERWVVGERELGGIVRGKFTQVDGGATPTRARDAGTPGVGSRFNEFSLHKVPLMASRT